MSNGTHRVLNKCKRTLTNSTSDKLISLLQSCNKPTEISQIHSVIIKTGLDTDTFTVSKLLASSIHHTHYAASIFKNTQSPNLFMFNTLLRAYSISDNPNRAFVVFNQLRASGLLLDQFSFVPTLKACAHECDLWFGESIHGVVLRSGFLGFVNLKGSLLRFYGVCGRMRDARMLFDECSESNDLISWNTLMACYVQASRPGLVVELFARMVSCGYQVSEATLMYALCSLGDLRDLFRGKLVHAHCVNIEMCGNLNVVNALIEMYAKAGDINSGRKVFDRVLEKNIVVWNCMIDKYAKLGLLDEAVALLRLMKVEVKPNSSTLVGLLSACASSRSIRLGRSIYEYIEEERLVLDVVLGTALIDMFAKFGFLDKAIEIFERMESKDLKLWTAMISSYGIHGQARDAVALLYRMEAEGFQPNEVTFLAILNSCSHGGLVEEAVECFHRMVRVYGFSPKVEHYGCITDLFGRAGLLEEAHGLIQSLPIKTDPTAWRALLASCRVYGDTKLGECVRKVLVEMGDEHPTDSMLLYSTYAVAGRLPDSGKSIETMDVDVINRSSGKEAGYSTIDMDNQWLEDEIKGYML